MSWRFQLEGETYEMEALGSLAHLYDCAINVGSDERYSFGGNRFDQIAAVGQARAEAEAILVILNGLAKFSDPLHRSVRLGSTSYAKRDDGSEVHHIELRPGLFRNQDIIYPPTVTGGDPKVGVVSGEDRMFKRILNDPKLREILEAISGETSWQRLRVVFEKITALVGKSRKDDNALVKNGYATRDEISSFKANAEDPRHTGLNAVHGVPNKGPLKGTKMTEREGLEFVTRLVKLYARNS